MASSSKTPNVEDSSCSISKKDSILADDAVSGCEEVDNASSISKKQKAQCTLSIRLSEGKLKKQTDFSFY